LSTKAKPLVPADSLATPPGVPAALASPSAATSADVVVAAPGTKDDVEKRRRARTMSRKQMAREHRKMRARGDVVEAVDYWRPTNRSECLEMERPCLYVSCRHHLYLDVNPETGSVKLNFPDKEVWELAETCALDVADRGGITLEEVGVIMNLTRERIRQVEVRGLEKLKEVPEALGGLDAYVDWDPYDSSEDY
jgi:hypothetical protein